MASTDWERIALNLDDISNLDEIDKEIGHYSSLKCDEVARESEEECVAGASAGIDNLQNALVKTEENCSLYLQDIDKVLSSLDDINNSYEEVTGRSNTLVDNCETLLEQQHSLQVTVEKPTEL